MTRIAFYAPLKPADHAVASGDRTVARLFLAALRQAGFEPHVASDLRARIALPDPAAMARKRDQAEKIAARIARFWRKLPPKDRPAAWFTYHVYYKAVDWIGPVVAQALSIPYVIAEASHAPKRAQGPWAFNHAGAQSAIQAADAILCLNPSDKECLRQIAPAKRLIDFPPFLQIDEQAETPRERARHALAERHGLEPDARWLLAVGMMRAGDKLASYRVLGEALRRRKFARTQLIVVGDGPAKGAVKRALADVGVEVAYAGFVPGGKLRAYYAAADLMVWPAINEAFGMALLEAQAAGLPVLAGASGGVPSIIAEGKSGFLAQPGDPAAFARGIDKALESDLGAMRARARAYARRRHGMDRAVGRLLATFAGLGVRP